MFSRSCIHWSGVEIINKAIDHARKLWFFKWFANTALVFFPTATLKHASLVTQLYIFMAAVLLMLQGVGRT